ncbi:HSPB1-associated protein 1-like isoform X2 [Lytechinus variegatus]|nr:HSPB1-associated protein 1-like isoform X2 [Lytechinus variegatus]
MKEFCEWCRHNSSDSDLSPEVFPRVELDRDNKARDLTVDGSLHVDDRALSTRKGSGNPLMLYKKSNFWCYADYKHMKHLFKDSPSVLEDVRWKDLGFDCDGNQSTIWIGSEGANTPCHQDTYGFNLVAQIRGRKKWHLFPPSQTELMYPTRIPYEESSVFSLVNVKSPDLNQHPKFGEATPYEVVLHPGDILFVPKLWWHFVESLDTSISINCWIDLESDHESRLDEAICRTLVCGLMSVEGHDEENEESQGQWLNPTEEATNRRQNLTLLSHAVNTFCQLNSKTSCEMEETNVSANVPEALISLKQTDPLRHCYTTKRDTLKEHLQRNIGSDERETRVTMDEKPVQHDEEVDLENTKGMSLYQQTFQSDWPSTLSTAPITTDPIHGGSSTQGLLTNSNSNLVELGSRPSGIKGMDRGQNQSDSVKRIKLCDNVTIPVSGMMVAKQSVFSVPCNGSVTQLTASRQGNDCANLKIEQEMGISSGTPLETSDSFVDVTMAMVVECLTQPNIITLLRRGLLEKVQDKQKNQDAS